MKNTYLFFVIALGLLATSLTYYFYKKPAANLISPLSETSSRLSRGIGACKNARLEVSGVVFQMKNGLGEASDPAVSDGKLTLTYANRADRGYMDNGSAFDMACAYEMTNYSGTKRTYVGILLGLTEDSYAPVGTALVGEGVVITNLNIQAGKVNISTTSYLDRERHSQAFMLEGDTLVAI